LRYSRIILSICITLAAASASRAQLPDMQPLATNVARSIAKSNQQSVVVLDFVGPENKISELGRTLAEKFNADLAKANNGFSVTERGRIAESLANKGLSLWGDRDVDVDSWIVGDIGVQSFVFGTLKVSGDRLSIEVDCYSVNTEKRIAGVKTTSSISDEMQKLIGQTFEYPQPDFYSGIPTAGKNGHTYPKCVYCPQATYTAEAIKNHSQGTVILTVTVGADGKAADIVVKKSLPAGLTENAVQAVKSWRFDPALGPNGKPAAVHQVIEVTYHLYK
jgi:TonB family protein